MERNGKARLPRAVLAAALLLGLACWLAPSVAMAQAPDARREPHEWTHRFPLWGERLAERGIHFPLPWGVGLNYVYADQPIDIETISIGVNDSEMVDISEIIEFDEIKSTVHIMNARLDLWVLPFMNAYVMGNYAVESETDVQIGEPFEFQAGAIQSGLGGGFGMTFAGGYKGFFGTLDMNWSWNKMEKLNHPVGTFVLGPRVGRNFGKVGGVELIFWVGAMRQKIESETSGEINLNEAIGDASGFKDQLNDWYNELPPGRQALVRGLVGRINAGGDTTIRYDLDKRIAQPWNMLIGGEVGLSDHWRLRTEFGFIGRTQFLVGVNYRFGGLQKKKTPQEDDGKTPEQPKQEAK